MKIDVKNEVMFFYKTLMYYVTFFGSYLFVGVSILVLFFINQKEFSAKFLIGIVISMAVEYTVKFFYKHRRPDFNKDNEKALFEKFQERSSFPSGHSSTIALFTTLLVRTYSNFPLSVLFIILTLLVGASRVFLKRHYIADVIAGYAIGIIVGSIL